MKDGEGKEEKQRRKEDAKRKKRGIETDEQR